MASFYADKISFVRVRTTQPSIQTQAQGQKGITKCLQGVDLQRDDLEHTPMTANQVRDAYYSSEHENSLRDVYFEVTLNMEADEPLSVELFQAFGPLIAVRFKNRVFTRIGGYKNGPSCKY